MQSQGGIVQENALLKHPEVTPIGLFLKLVAFVAADCLVSPRWPGFSAKSFCISVIYPGPDFGFTYTRFGRPVAERWSGAVGHGIG